MDILNDFLLNKAWEFAEIIKIDVQTVKEITSKWFMSKIFEASSNKWDVIVHCYMPIKQQIIEQTHLKIKLISDFVRANTEIPTSEIFVSYQYQWYYIIIQQKLQWKILGYRTIENNEIIDIFELATDDILQKIIIYLRDLHNIKFTGFGYPVLENGKLKGSFQGWAEFLDKMWNIWLDSLFSNYNEQEKFLTKTQYQYIKEYLKNLLDFNSEILSKVQPSLVLWDAANPSNILIDGNKITWFIDFEWGLIWDRAREFAYGDDWRFLTKDYFVWFTQQEIADFQVRLKISKIYRLLWWSNVHVKWNQIKDILFKEFSNLIKKND